VTTTQDPGRAGSSAGLHLFDDYSQHNPNQALQDAVRTTAYHYDDRTRSVYVLRASDVEGLLVDERFWSKRPKDRRLEALPPGERAIQERLKHFISLWPAFSDGEYHDRVRKEIVVAMHRAVTKELDRAIGEQVAALLDGQQGRRFDWITEVASPLAAYGIGALVGIDAGDVAHLITLASPILHELATPLIDQERATAALAAADQLQAWLGIQVADPGSALLAGLARIWNDPGTGPVAATAMLTQVVTGALDPVVSTLAVLAQRVTPEVLTATEPAVLREEVIRLAVPFRFTPRYARCPVEVGGYHVAEQGRIMLGLGSANLDPSGNSGRRDEVSREEVGHFSFGRGRHYCLGATYTRALIGAVIAGLSQRGLVFRIEEMDREPELTMLRFRKLIGRLTPIQR
jgi:cytochrome P450